MISSIDEKVKVIEEVKGYFQTNCPHCTHCDCKDQKLDQKIVAQVIDDMLGNFRSKLRKTMEMEVVAAGQIGMGMFFGEPRRSVLQQTYER